MATICEEILDLLRQRAEAVDELGAEAFDVAVVLDLGEPAVEREPHRQIGDVVFRNEDGVPMVICGDHLSATGRADAGLHRDHRLFQHLLIKLEADFLDVAGLLVAKEIAGAADVEIVGGELEAGAERVERFQNFQPALGLRRDFAPGRQREQRIGAHFERPTRPRS